MLALTRQLDEEIVIDGTTRVKVVAIDRQRVRLGIIAPPRVAVDRDEVHQRREKYQITPAGNGCPAQELNGEKP